MSQFCSYPTGSSVCHGFSMYSTQGSAVKEAFCIPLNIAFCNVQRSSRRAAAKGRKRYSDYDYDEDLADDVGALSGDDDGPSPKRFRNVRFTTEDRRFGKCCLVCSTLPPSA